MLTKRIIPCLDIKNGKVIKGLRFRQHEIVGDIVELAQRYTQQGADELVFYDITASSDQRTVNTQWIRAVAQHIDIPFCIAGGIRTLKDAEAILNAGADKISLNSPALERPDLICELAERFGRQCVVIGIDSLERNGRYQVYQYTGDINKTIKTTRNTLDWAIEVQQRGAGEIVLNCINQDGVRQGYDIQQLQAIQKNISIPIVASGGAGTMSHFKTVFENTNVTGALAASVFHKNLFTIPELKRYLLQNHIEVRP